MKQCGPCVEVCKARGGNCAPLDRDEREAADVDIGPPWRSWIRRHRQEAHPTTIQGAVYRCPEGHVVEADPVAVMRAAGIKPLF